ncbi:hypothetical protein PGTUg99_025494 [Puccinia graminis f. sp. tritici]|uniref:Uncharacterized protein n=1 Tax=Puccinia graminis f. sp. tritici TaxID=56615 RepID=A0A5B0QKB9_PUCGR|nr:hypothetical protein PGTUg99_010242 [Puccinia graminis f. sp. tritici]KAA1131790.1 hypothetical protein PGTUg99_025494 [Puccinia graminis f. sp. tritici]
MHRETDGGDGEVLLQMIENLRLRLILMWMFLPEYLSQFSSTSGRTIYIFPKLMFPGLLEATITASSRAICIRTTKHAEAEETLPNHSNSAFIRTVMQRRKEGMQSNAHLIPHESPNS